MRGRTGSLAKEGSGLIYTIDELKQKIVPIAARYNLPAVYLFGSYARNEATEESDVDILIDSGFYVYSANW